MPDSALNDLQVDVLRLFFSLPTSDGFILAGGAGLVAVGLSERPTEDIDLFAATASVGIAGDGLERAAEGRGWVIERVQDSPTFRRLVITTDAGRRLLVDLARDAGPLSEVAVTPGRPCLPGRGARRSEGARTVRSSSAS